MIDIAEEVPDAKLELSCRDDLSLCCPEKNTAGTPDECGGG